MKQTLILTLALAALASPALAQPAASSAGEFTRGYGMGWEGFETPIEASTRDENGNRTIVNGRMEIEGTLTGGLMDNYGSGLGAQAIGNQLNVVTQGNYNTVIVDSTQINNGDISADAGDQ